MDRREFFLTSAALAASPLVPPAAAPVFVSPVLPIGELAMSRQCEPMDWDYDAHVLRLLYDGDLTLDIDWIRQIGDAPATMRIRQNSGEWMVISAPIERRGRSVIFDLSEYIPDALLQWN